MRLEIDGYVVKESWEALGFVLEQDTFKLSSDYCRFGNFRVIFISRTFYFRIIGEVLNLRTSIRVVFISVG